MWYVPAAMASHPAGQPGDVHRRKRFSCVPSPSWPALLYPQHLTPPAAVRAQVCYSPAAMAVTPLDSPVTSTGVRRSVVVPSPSWPSVLLPST